VNIFELVVVQPIFNLLMGLYALVPGRDFGVAIIIFTVIVRFALYPLTRSMLHQSKAMRKLQPELARIKKQTKGNKQAESVAMMELYKKHGVSPFRSIGILLIQLPIFIALFQVIQIFTLHRNRIELFTYGFMKQFEPIKDLIANPSHFNEKLLGIVDLTKSAFSHGHIDIFLILLAVIAGVTQYIMSRQTTPKAQSKRRIRDIMADAAEGKQADQGEMNAIVMQRMSKVLPLFMFFVMISVPGALALYYAVSNLVAVGQQAYLLRQDEEELEEIAEEIPAKKQSAKQVKTISSKPPKPEKSAITKNGATVTRIVAKDTGRKK
jgi:YidC/Oxa1 family membrane protein insertase